MHLRLWLFSFLSPMILLSCPVELFPAGDKWRPQASRSTPAWRGTTAPGSLPRTPACLAPTPLRVLPASSCCSGFPAFDDSHQQVGTSFCRRASDMSLRVHRLCMPVSACGMQNTTRMEPAGPCVARFSQPSLIPPLVAFRERVYRVQQATRTKFSLRTRQHLRPSHPKTPRHHPWRTTWRSRKASSTCCCLLRHSTRALVSHGECFTPPVPRSTRTPFYAGHENRPEHTRWARARVVPGTTSLRPDDKGRLLQLPTSFFFSLCPPNCPSSPP